MPRTRDAPPIKRIARTFIPKLKSRTRLENFSPIPVRLTIPTIIPAAAHATETMTAFFAPFSSAFTMDLNCSILNLARLVFSGAGIVQRIKLAIRLMTSVLMTATNPAIMGE